jgi:hypothetical protein
MNDIDTDAKAPRRWIFHDALPLWWEVGAHRGRGAFHEAISRAGRLRVRTAPDRSREGGPAHFGMSESTLFGSIFPLLERFVDPLGC